MELISILKGVGKLPVSRRVGRRNENRKELCLPIIEPGVDSYKLVRWLVREGDSVEIEQDLAELAYGTERFLLPSPLDGIILELYTAPNETISPGDVLALLEET